MRLGSPCLAVVLEPLVFDRDRPSPLELRPEQSLEELGSGQNRDDLQHPTIVIPTPVSASGHGHSKRETI
jgi:hypothetical protein